MQEACVIHNMNSPVDYRRLAHHTRGLYFLTPDRTALLHKAFLENGEDSLIGAAAAGSSSSGGVGNPGPVNVDVAMGRTLHVPQALGACRGSSALRFRNAVTAAWSVCWLPRCKSAAAAMGVNEQQHQPCRRACRVTLLAHAGLHMCS
jgi:hypothetical protein